VDDMAQTINTVAVSHQKISKMAYLLAKAYLIEYPDEVPSKLLCAKALNACSVNSHPEDRATGLLEKLYKLFDKKFSPHLPADLGSPTLASGVEESSPTVRPKWRRM